MQGIKKGKDGRKADARDEECELRRMNDRLLQEMKKGKGDERLMQGMKNGN